MSFEVSVRGDDIFRPKIHTSCDDNDEEWVFVIVESREKKMCASADQPHKCCVQNFQRISLYLNDLVSKCFYDEIELVDLSHRNDSKKNPYTQF